MRKIIGAIFEGAGRNQQTVLAARDAFDQQREQRQRRFRFAESSRVGTNRNLVLLDGTRLVPSSPLSETDLNIIPVALIERAEIVTGGAWSVYGADAIVKPAGCSS